MSQTPARAAAHRRFDVTIRGGGVVGQTLALLLARERLRVALVGAPRPTPMTGGPEATEASPEAASPAAPLSPAAPDVRAYALNAASRALLQSVRGWPETTAETPWVTPVSAMRVWGDDGGALHFSADAQGADALAWIVDVPALEQRLAQAVQFQSGIECLEQPAPAALTVICEGRRSSSREQLGLEHDVRPYPHKALAARLRCALPHGGVARQWFHQGEVLALLPLEGAGGNAVALVWSLEAARADALLAGDPGALARAVQARCAELLGEMQLAGPAHGWPLEQSRARRWVTSSAQGGFALAGDAAHAMHPLAGQGLNVGLADVAELARVLQNREYWRGLGELKLLRRYERARQAEVGAMGWLTDGLFDLFAQPDTRVQALRNWGMQGVDRLVPVKRWLARQAMGQTG